ncbi:MAG: SPOR domain-containing protein [Desulfovibrio sp.]|jgi:cell division protein FtsN|nr:SPOR domain-containing protein [Desulfovibrio sp.]
MKFSFFPNGLRFRVPSLVAMCFLFAAAIVLAYVAGVMRGRAYSAHDSVVSGQQDAGTSADAGRRDGSGAETGKDVAQEGKRVLAPEELHFVSVLRNDVAALTRQQQTNVQPAKPAVAPPPPSLSVSSENPAEAQKPQSKTSGLFDYVFQVAAFKDEDNVDSLRQRLEGRGLRTRMQREGKVLLVLVLLRGGEQRAAEVLKLMEEMRLGAPIVRSRKPVP